MFAAAKPFRRVRINSTNSRSAPVRIRYAVNGDGAGRERKAVGERSRLDRARVGERRHCRLDGCKGVVSLDQPRLSRARQRIHADNVHLGLRVCVAANRVGVGGSRVSDDPDQFPRDVRLREHGNRQAGENDGVSDHALIIPRSWMYRGGRRMMAWFWDRCGANLEQ